MVRKNVKDDTKSSNTVWQLGSVKRKNSESLNGHSSFILWFTGLPSSGKSTIANAVENILHNKGCRTIVLDGDNVRHGLCGDLEFTEADRQENIRRIGEVSKLFLDAGVIVLAAFISPFMEDRKNVRKLFKKDEFIEIFVNCPSEICEKRDPKGLYEKARKGEILNFTGVSAPYEIPIKADIEVKTEELSIEESAEKIIRFLVKRRLFFYVSN